MRLLTLILTFGLLNNVFGQTFLALDTVLKNELPENSKTDRRWVYYSDSAKIEKIEKSLVKAVLTNYDLYKVTLTNYTGYAVNQGTCIVLFDSLNSSMVLVEPLWYGGVSEPLIKLFFKRQFDNKDKLLNFLNELNELMEIGSGYKFVNRSSTDSLIKYDLVRYDPAYFKDCTYVTDGNGVSSSFDYSQDRGIWKQIEIKIKNFKIVEYVYINPELKDSKKYPGYYKQTIK